MCWLSCVSLIILTDCVNTSLSLEYSPEGVQPLCPFEHHTEPDVSLRSVSPFDYHIECREESGQAPSPGFLDPMTTTFEPQVLTFWTSRLQVLVLLSPTQVFVRASVRSVYLSLLTEIENQDRTGVG